MLTLSAGDAVGCFRSGEVVYSAFLVCVRVWTLVFPSLNTQATECTIEGLFLSRLIPCSLHPLPYFSHDRNGKWVPTSTILFIKLW